MTDEEHKIWQEGYEAGVKITLHHNDEAIQLGRAMLAVLDNVYARHPEDY